MSTILVVGASGSGKSSLINMLMGNEICITSDSIEGCTDRIHSSILRDSVKQNMGKLHMQRL